MTFNKLSLILDNHFDIITFQSHHDGCWWCSTSADILMVNYGSGVSCAEPAEALIFACNHSVVKGKQGALKSGILKKIDNYIPWNMVGCHHLSTTKIPDIVSHATLWASPEVKSKFKPKTVMYWQENFDCTDANSIAAIPIRCRRIMAWLDVILENGLYFVYYYISWNREDHWALHRCTKPFEVATLTIYMQKVYISQTWKPT